VDKWINGFLDKWMTVLSATRELAYGIYEAAESQSWVYET
jgi:hypothetical protein